jgi:hypothetical protein
MKLCDSIDKTVILYESTLAGSNMKIYLEPIEENVDLLIIENSKNSPLQVNMAAGMASKKMDSYYANKNRVTRFYGNCINTRKLYSKVVKDLLATGKYKKLRQVWVNGGLMWDLERIK